MISQNGIAILVKGVNSVSSFIELALKPNIAKWQQKKAGGLRERHGCKYGDHFRSAPGAGNYTNRPHYNSPYKGLDRWCCQPLLTFSFKYNFGQNCTQL